MKILSHFAHGVYQTELSKIPDVSYYHVVDTDHKLFLKGTHPKTCWNPTDAQPNNILSINAEDVKESDFELILAHWHPFIEPFHKLWPNLPIIMTEHTWPYKNLPSEVFKWRKIRHENCVHTVFITPSSQKAWQATNDPAASYVYHSIDIDNFPQKTDYMQSKQVMTTTNEFISRDWACGFSLWANVLGVPMKPYFDDIALYGYGNDNIGKVAKGIRSRDEILQLLQEAGVYFNPAPMSPIPLSLLEAAAVGTPLVSVTHCEAGNVFKNNIHGIFSNDPVELRKGIQEVLANPQKAKFMADKAKEVVIEKFKPSRFQEEWRMIFEKVSRN